MKDYYLNGSYDSKPWPRRDQVLTLHVAFYRMIPETFLYIFTFLRFKTAKMTSTQDAPSLGESNSISKGASLINANLSANENFKFSPTGQELALTTHDGRMTVWDAHTRQVKHQYTPSKHLSAVCTCLSWIPLKEQSTTPNK